jgi:hypothetical protein
MAWFWIIVTIALLINAPGTRTPAPYPLPFPGRGAGKGERVRGPTDTFRYHSWIYSRMVPTRRYVHMNSTIRDSTQGDKVRRRTHMCNGWYIEQVCASKRVVLAYIEQECFASVRTHIFHTSRPDDTDDDNNEPRSTRTCIQQLSFLSRTSTSFHDPDPSAPVLSASTRCHGTVEVAACTSLSLYGLGLHVSSPGPHILRLLEFVPAHAQYRRDLLGLFFVSFPHLVRVDYSAPQCGSGVGQAVGQAWISCGSGVDQVWISCGSGVGWLWIRCGSDVDQMWIRCGSGVDQLWIRCGSGCGALHDPLVVPLECLPAVLL